ncbi:MAG: Gldg family protein [Candidatus Omnitrophica bacterium]|nr:Gldg family protein [Candidatus Omnitrophota bacterium]
MRNFFIRFQFLIVAVLLLATFALMMAIINRYNRRWDMTPQKIYSLAAPTVDLLTKLKRAPVEVIAFYPSNEPYRGDFEIFLKACQLRHGQFRYEFYDPNRRPQMAKQWRVQELYTVIVRYRDRQERVIFPNEATFSSALLRLLNPKDIAVGFLSEKEDDEKIAEGPEGFRLLREALTHNHLPVTRIGLRELKERKVPEECQVIVIAAPQTTWSAEDLGRLKEFFDEGRGLLFLIDPMDPGTGGTFKEFMKGYGVLLGEDVVIDKMSRAVGGDFLVPIVEQYSRTHPATAHFDIPTFYPVARSVTPSIEVPGDLSVAAIAFTGSNSWAETKLAELEKGNAVFESDTDYPGPIPIAVAVEKKRELNERSLDDVSEAGRMIVIGDSDFLTNTYLRLSGNEMFIMTAVRWLARDERQVVIENPHPQFEPLFLNSQQHAVLLVTALLGYPLFFLGIGVVQNLWRRRTR